jgi:hypothetical protein
MALCPLRGSTFILRRWRPEHNLRRTIEHIGSLDANCNDVYFEANPGEGIATSMFSTGLTPVALNTTPKPVREYDALDISVSRC